MRNLLITDYGEIEMLPGETEAAAVKRAYEQWERSHFRRGGWAPMTEAEFEAGLANGSLSPADSKNFQDFKSDARRG